MITLGKINDKNCIETKVFDESENDLMNLFLKENKDWYLVEEIDHSKISVDQNSYTDIIPYFDEKEKMIRYKYKLVKSNKGVIKSISKLQDQLASSDYKIIKCYELFLLNKEMPYDVTALAAERQSLRDSINDLKSQLI